jgi:hypothetical protein
MLLITNDLLKNTKDIELKTLVKDLYNNVILLDTFNLIL